MILVATAAVGAVACTKKTDVADSQTPTPEETERATERVETTQTAEPTAEATAEARAEAHSFHLFDNGTRCVTWPCPSWSALDGPKEVKVTHVNLDALKLDDAKKKALMAELAKGYMVTGHIERGPQGPAGEGTTLVVTKLGEPKRKPVR